MIRNLRIAKAGVFFPMPDIKVLDKSLGSRHRAALGITEETDAVVVVVSEERGTISFCFNGNIIPNLDGASLKQALLGLFGQRARAKKKTTTGKHRASLVPPPPLRITLPPASPTLGEMREKAPSLHGDLGVAVRRPAIMPEESVPAGRLGDPTATRPMQPAAPVMTPLPTSIPRPTLATPMPTPVPMQRSSTAPSSKDGND